MGSNTILNSHESVFRNPEYRVEPFRTENNNIQLQLKTTKEKNPIIINYDNKSENLRYDEMYYYYLPQRRTTKFSLSKNPEDEFTCKGSEMLNDAIISIRQSHNLQKIISEKEGTTIGKIHIDKGAINLPNAFDNFSEPTIIIEKKPIIYNLDNPNIVAIITTPDISGGLSHIGSLLKSQTDLFGISINPEDIKRLEALEGKNVEMKLKNGDLSFQVTDKIGTPRIVKKIDIPEQTYCNKILTPDECTESVIGNKAVKLNKLKLMKKEGKIDAIIPNFIALPFGYLEEKGFPIPIHKELISDGSAQELLDELKRNGVTADKLAVRSAFNDEDLNHSTAGVYDSFLNVKDIYEILDSAAMVYTSKWKTSSTKLRKYYGISDDKIKPGIIIQNQIDTDYTFTIYTDDGDGNLKIDFRTNENTKRRRPQETYDNLIVSPHIFYYNKKNDKLTYNSKQVRHNIGAQFDKDCKLKETDAVETDLTDNKELFGSLKNVIKDALTVEKEIGVPQDIEGGLTKDGKVYFWQTRNVVHD